MRRRGFFHWIGVLAIVAVAAWGIARVVHAAGGPHGGRGPWHHMKGFYGMKEHGPLGRLAMADFGRLITLHAELNITEEQHDQLEALVHENHDEIAERVKNLVETKQALAQAVLADEPNEDAIRAASEKLGRAVADAAVLGAKLIEEARGVLTPEQVELIEEFFAEHDEAVSEWLDGEHAK